MLGANCLIDDGDPQALDALSQCFDALPVSDDDTTFESQVFIEWRDAIEALGGQLTAEQEAKAERADAPRRRFVGCWCGSGKKYKKCHLDLDR